MIIADQLQINETPASSKRKKTERFDKKEKVEIERNA